MKRPMIRMLALVLSLLLLTGCGSDWQAYSQALSDAASQETTVTWEDMTYTRPDMDVLESVLAEACETAAGEDFDQIIRMVYAFYDVYDDFYTNYSLADIHYCADMTDSHWEAETDFCAEHSARVDAALEELYYALAKSPCLEQLESEEYFGAGYFDSYQGKNNWDAEFTALLEAESDLVQRYYDLSAIGADYEPGSEAYYEACGNDMVQLLVQLIRQRRRIAAYWGYDNYNEFATDFYYYRDYSVAQSRAYLSEIQTQLVPLYRELNSSGFWEDGFPYATEDQTFAYVRDAARNMGGIVAEAFQQLSAGGLYDIGYGANKYPSSFEVYLTTYERPFIFMSPTMTTYDFLTFAHEFGHFCNDYASWGSYAGVDVLEVFSQGMEYLSLCYRDDPEALTRLKMADSLCIYVEQAAFATFEMMMYEIPEAKLTSDALIALYDRVAGDFGFDSVGFDAREFVTITHYYTNPLYIMSYVVSNDAALQLYQMEMETPGSGLACFTDNLDTMEYYFLSFLDYAGLDSPFDPGRIHAVRETFEQVLK